MEHLALNAAKRKDRDVNHGDDADAKQAGPNHLAGGGVHHVQAFLKCQLTFANAALRFRQATNAVFHHDDRAINNETEVQRAQAHQIGRYAGADHAGHGGQHRQRNNGGGDQRRTDVTQQQKQHNDHQQCTFQQVLLHRGDGFIDQCRAVIQGLNENTVRQGPIDHFKALCHIAGHSP